MKNFIITTDSTSDLKDEFLEQNGVVVLPVPFACDGVQYSGTKENRLFGKEFYDKIRNGSMPSTSLISPEIAREYFENILKQGKDVLHLSFSSGLSGTYNACRMAAEELNNLYENKVYVVDTLSASLGLGFLIKEAVKMKQNGSNIEEITKRITTLAPHLVHAITVDDLFHLQRGGRISKATAVIGSAFNFKPLIYMNDEGKLINFSKTIGRKKSLMALCDWLVKKRKPEIYEEVMIVHGDCEEDAKYLAKLIEEKANCKVSEINMLSCILGTHCGAGMCAVVFASDSRQP